MSAKVVHDLNRARKKITGIAMYKILIGIKEEKFDNLNQVYGFLCGIFEDYKKSKSTFKQFKSSWSARKKRGELPYKIFSKEISCQIHVVPHRKA